MLGCHLPSMIVMGSPGSIRKAPGSVTSLTQRPSESLACGDRRKGVWAFGLSHKGDKKVKRKDLPLCQSSKYAPGMSSVYLSLFSPLQQTRSEVGLLTCPPCHTGHGMQEPCLSLRGPRENHPVPFFYSTLSPPGLPPTQPSDASAPPGQVP